MENIQPQEKKYTEKKIKKLVPFFKKHKKPIVIILAVLLLFLAVTTTLSSIKAHKAKTQLENKIFITDAYSDGAWIKIYAFKDGKIATESWYLNSLEISGDITAFNHKYKVVASIFSDKIDIMTKYQNGWVKTVTVYLDDAGAIQHYKYTESMPDWHETTLEAIENLQIRKMCNHAFGEWVITKVASCTVPGEKKQVCQKCNFEQTEQIFKEHDYVNSICSVCGSKKAAEKADITANTWYTYDGGPLCVQNCLVKSATSIGQGKGMMVQYHAVCQHCHAIDETSKLAGPEVNYEVKKVYYCNECGGQTLIRLKID